MRSADGRFAMSDATPLPVRLDKVLDGLAGNPALPSELVRRLFAYRKGRQRAVAVSWSAEAGPYGKGVSFNNDRSCFFRDGTDAASHAMTTTSLPSSMPWGFCT